LILFRFILLGTLFFFIIIGVILPNVFNGREKAHYSKEVRVEYAREHYHQDNLTDSVKVAAAAYYDNRSALHNKLFGKKYRELWNTPVTVPVLRVNDSINHFICYKMGGGLQSITIDLQDQDYKMWTLRSIDKDQSKAIHPLLRYTIVRPIIRDQVAAMDPYGAFVVDDLSEAAGIPHTNPRLVFVPYLESLRNDCRLRMAGRLALLEEELDEPGWENNPSFLDAEIILDTEDMFKALHRYTDHSIDTNSYLKARLFDILISDWDRHEGQWVWALKNKIYHPIPVDRDMAFYLFDDGWVNKMFLLFNNKFQSFHPDIKDVSGYVKNSLPLDLRLLKGFPEEKFVEQAERIQHDLTDQEIDKAFKNYPPAIYEKVGEEHAAILKERRSELKIAAKEFFAAINKGY
jgi:hypothetical protein